MEDLETGAGKISRKEQIDSVLNNEKPGDKDEDLAVQNDKRHISTPIPVAASVAGYASVISYTSLDHHAGTIIPIHRKLLQMKRGTVEGLNPLMFLFALVGNSTYVSSILVNSTKWSKIKPNLPWLVDAAACVVLDAFIIAQFIYYSRLRTKECRNNQRYLKVWAS
ncbi:putative vacuolar amino acid transporter [Nymphaea thermarum]|nr:putative vacuolar amino acid transporter [Nymphaea thermarum]